jgi:hypothetical protein
MLATTYATLYNNTSGTGVCYRNGASFDILSASDNALILNRTGSDGVIAEFRKAGTIVGSIDVTTTSLTVSAITTLAFQTASTECMRIDSSGNVGIGTSSPTYKVDISSAGDGAANIQSTGTASSSFLRLVGRQSSVNNEWNIISTGNGLAGPQLRFVNGTWTNAASMFIDTSSNLTIGGSTATKASGTTWSNPSDQRLKSNIMDYPKGITELMQVRVREWEYNGKGGTTAGMAGLGVIADEVMTVLPNTVDTYDAKLDEADEETTAIKKFDATEITWLLVKAVQEQQAIITALEARIAALEA